jgi:hypothetical protein
MLLAPLDYPQGAVLGHGHPGFARRRSEVSGGNELGGACPTDKKDRHESRIMLVLIKDLDPIRIRDLSKTDPVACPTFSVRGSLGACQGRSFRPSTQTSTRRQRRYMAGCIDRPTDTKCQDFESALSRVLRLLSNQLALLSEHLHEGRVIPVPLGGSLRCGVPTGHETLDSLMIASKAGLSRGAASQFLVGTVVPPLRWGTI